MKITGYLQSLIQQCERIPYSVVALGTRLAVATVFWRSARTKVDGWQITDATYALFQEEYRVPFLSPEVAAVLATVQEHLFSILLVVGLASRLSALGLFGMTAVIQLFVYPENWPDHLLWGALLLTIIARGPGAFSLDYGLTRLLEPLRVTVPQLQ